MLKRMVVSLLAVSAGAPAASAQTVLWGEPQPAEAPRYLPPVQQTFPNGRVIQVPQQQPTQPLYYETLPSAPAPIYIEPQPYTEPTAPPPQYRVTPSEVQPQRFEPAPAIRETVRPSAPPAVAAMSSRPDAVREFASELGNLIDLAERYRAASPGFLEDLKKLAAKYESIELGVVPASPEDAAALAEAQTDAEAALAEAVEETVEADPAMEADTEIAGLDIDPVLVPEPEMDPALETQPAEEPVELPQALPPTSAAVVYLRDDFADGDFVLNPAWTVREGAWTVDPDYGLRAQAPRPQAAAPITPKDLLQYLLGDEKPEADQPAPESSAALIESQMTIGNAFSLVATVTDHVGEGAAHFILHQGGASWLGYRLELRAGPRPLVVLARRGASGYKDIMKVEAPGFTTGKPHQLRWARLRDGQMFVLIDGDPIITARDTVFQQGWSGFGYFVAGGDVSMRNIRIAEPVEQ